MDITDTNIHIRSSHLVRGRRFRNWLRYLRWMYPVNGVLLQRSDFSLKMEWACHNFLYKLGIQRSRTGDVDLDIKDKYRVMYFIMGPLVWIWIR